MADSAFARFVFDRSLVRADMPHHAKLTGWPQGDDEDAKLQRIDIATDLADAAVYVAGA